MNFIELINDQQRNLQSKDFMEMLWCKINGKYTIVFDSLEEELYCNHIPIELSKFLNNCNLKLYDLKANSGTLKWEKLDLKYLSTLLYYILEMEDVSMTNALYAANIFFLINNFNKDDKKFFFEEIYMKILTIIMDFSKTEELPNNTISLLLDNFKIFLLNFLLPDSLVVYTVSVLHVYTYFCEGELENVDTDVTCKNLGSTAFLGLKILCTKFSKQRNGINHLYVVLLCLTSSLKSTLTKHLSTVIKANHQKNVRLFLKNNFDIFYVDNVCVITDLLKFVCLSSDYDEYEAIARLIQQLPCKQGLLTFIQNTMLCQKLEFRRNILRVVVQILNHLDRNLEVEFLQALLQNLVILLIDDNAEIREVSLKTLAEVSENNIGQSVLSQIIISNKYIKKESFSQVLYEMLYKNWHKKNNINYIRLMSNILKTQKDLATLKTMNRFRDVCLKSSPADLKPCIAHLKSLLKIHFQDSIIVMYILNIFIKQMFHPMTTSALFGKELHEFLFSSIGNSTKNEYAWTIFDYLISNNFDAISIFDKFNSLNLLKPQQLKTIMEPKVSNAHLYTPALKLLCVMLHFVQYNKCDYLHDKLEESIKDTGSIITVTDQSLILYALTKIIEKKKISDCSPSDINNYRKIQALVYHTFLKQMFPNACVSYVIMLLKAYTQLFGDEAGWDTTACLHLEKHFTNKLIDVCNAKLNNYLYLSRDVVYISELVVLCNTKLSKINFKRLQQIMFIKDHTPKFREYLLKYSKVWSLCVLLYMKVCFVNMNMTNECVVNLQNILSIANENLQLQILYGLLDFCNMHLQYYDPLLPHLFNALQNKHAFIRLISAKIIIHLINNEHLRLMDGQYFLFMSLLVDEKNIITSTIEMFVKEKYTAKYNKTIARYFVPSIVHYNLFYDHPTIKLSTNDQELLKHHHYSKKNRAFIYYCLYLPLPDNLKYKVLNELCNEILVKIVKKTLPHTSTVYDILEDALVVILYTVPSKKITVIENIQEFYVAQIRQIEDDLLIPDMSYDKDLTPEINLVLKNLMKILFQLLYGELNKIPKVCQNLFFTIMILTNSFYHSMKYIVNDDFSQFGVLYKQLGNLYNSTKHQFADNPLLIHPSNLEGFFKEDTEFYITDSPNDHLISPYMFL